MTKALVFGLVASMGVAVPALAQQKTAHRKAAHAKIQAPQPSPISRGLVTCSNPDHYYQVLVQVSPTVPSSGMETPASILHSTIAPYSVGVDVQFELIQKATISRNRAGKLKVSWLVPAVDGQSTLFENSIILPGPDDRDSNPALGTAYLAQPDGSVYRKDITCSYLQAPGMQP